MTPSAKELEAKIGDTFVVSPEGAEKLNELFNLGAVAGDKVTILETQIIGIESNNDIRAKYRRSKVEFVLPLNGDFFEEKK